MIDFALHAGLAALMLVSSAERHGPPSEPAPPLDGLLSDQEERESAGREQRDKPASAVPS